MTRAIRIHQVGEPEVLQWENVDVGTPGPGQALIRQVAVGLNFIDTYLRTGLYPLASLPATLGMEGAGVVEAVGDGVSVVSVGDRVAYCTSIGAYAEQRLIPANLLIRIPDDISDRRAASMMLKGCTVQYLLRRTYSVGQGDIILFHAAAGGVGLIACQWAKYLGATVIGTVGSLQKEELARTHGCDYVINYKTSNFVERVKEITDCAGVQVVYDSVGKDTFMGSLECLKSRGLMVSFGQASGPVTQFNPGMLATAGSLYLTRPTLATYTDTREELVATTNDLFEVVQKGVVRIDCNQTYPLKEAAQAHRDLEARNTTGSTVLVIDA